MPLLSSLGKYRWTFKIFTFLRLQLFALIVGKNPLLFDSTTVINFTSRLCTLLQRLVILSAVVIFIIVVCAFVVLLLLFMVGPDFLNSVSDDTVSLWVLRCLKALASSSAYHMNITLSPDITLCTNSLSASRCLDESEGSIVKNGVYAR